MCVIHKMYEKLIWIKIYEIASLYSIKIILVFDTVIESDTVYI
jgi:hypothetical protein